MQRNVANYSLAETIAPTRVKRRRLGSGTRRRTRGKWCTSTGVTPRSPTEREWAEEEEEPPARMIGMSEMSVYRIKQAEGS